MKLVLRAMTGAIATCMALGAIPVSAETFEGDYISFDLTVSAHFKIFSPDDSINGDHRVSSVLGNVNGDPLMSLTYNPFTPEPTIDPALPVFLFTNTRVGEGEAALFNFGVIGKSGTHYLFFSSAGFLFPDRFVPVLMSGSEGILRSVTSGTFTVTALPAPEPLSWAMMLVGFAMIGGAMRIRREATASFS